MRARRYCRPAMAGTYLDRILDAHREVAARDERSLEALTAEALRMPPARGFRARLAEVAASGDLAVVAKTTYGHSGLRYVFMLSKKSSLVLD